MYVCNVCIMYVVLSTQQSIHISSSCYFMPALDRGNAIESDNSTLRYEY